MTFKSKKQSFCLSLYEIFDPKFFKKRHFSIEDFSLLQAYAAEIILDLGFSYVRLGLLSISWPHFCAKWSKMIFKTLEIHQNSAKLLVKSQNSYQLHLTSFLGLEIFQRKLTVCTVPIVQRS